MIVEYSCATNLAAEDGIIDEKQSRIDCLPRHRFVFVREEHEN
jgi:hypothetical protein